MIAEKFGQQVVEAGTGFFIIDEAPVEVAVFADSEIMLLVSRPVVGGTDVLCGLWQRVTLLSHGGREGPCCDVRRGPSAMMWLFVEFGDLPFNIGDFVSRHNGSRTSKLSI